MSLKIEVTNSLSRVWAPHDVLRELDKATSYPVEGAQFSPAYRNHVWDGREHLLRKSRKSGCHLLPTGALTDLDDILEGAEIIDCRRQPGDRRDIEWSGPPQRDYQMAAVEQALKNRGPFTGKGMLNLPIRSGKTKIAATLIQATGLRTLFVVPSELLLYQTADSFREDLSPAPVAMFGSGHHETDWITVATVQTLLKRQKQAKKLMSEVDLFIVDEAHHLEGPAWRKLLLQSDAPYKIGLSATIFVSRERENNKASIWLKACTGPILYRVSMNRLIKAGHLMTPRVLFYRFEHDRQASQPPFARDWHWVARECVAVNTRRNNMICTLTERAVKNKGMRVLIDTGRKDQMKMIWEGLIRRGVKAELIHGGTPSEKRWDIIRAFQARHVEAIVGTVFGEGVDIPELEVVINAEGQKSSKAAIQRMRNLTPCEGKGEVLFIDFADLGNPFLQKHALQRLKLYRGIRGFIVNVCQLGKPGKDPLADDR